MRTSPQRTQLHINVYMCSKKKNKNINVYIYTYVYIENYTFIGHALGSLRWRCYEVMSKMQSQLL